MAQTEQHDPYSQPDDPRDTVRLTISYPTLAPGTLAPGTMQARLICEPQNLDLHWTGTAHQQLLDWVNLQLERVIPHISSQLQVPEEAPPLPVHAVSIGDSQLDPPSAEELDMEFVDLTLRPEDCAAGNEPRMMEASGRLRVYVHSDEQASTRLPFRIEFVLTDLESGRSQTAAIEFGDIQPGEWAKEIRRSFPIPGKGNYRIKAVVRKSSNGIVVAESAGPTLRVVE